MTEEHHDHEHHAHYAKRDISALYTPGAIVIAGILVAGGLFFGLAGKGTATSAGQTAGQTPPPAVDIKTIKLDGEPYLGQANAPVVLAFWSDFQCPFCKAFEVGGVPQIPTPAALPDIIKNYVDTGKVKIVFKDFPFLGKDSTTAAEYGRSIWKLYPGQYFAWRTAMYVAQDQEGNTGFGDALSIDKLIKSKFPQMNDASIKADVAKNQATYDAAMQADMQEGEANGITGTPGFITGKTLISGAQPYAAFTAALDPQVK